MNTKELLADLAFSFEECRQLGKSRRPNYPTKLKERAIYLINTGMEVEDLAKKLCVSKATLESWIEKFRYSDGSKLDFIPVKPEETPVPPPKIENFVDLHVTKICFKVPKSELYSRVGQLLSSIGGVK